MAGKISRDDTAKRQTQKRRPHRKASVERNRSQQVTQTEQGFLFDPYWDDAFSAYYDPTLRTCCQLKY
jgi:hypothetical protein